MVERRETRSRRLLYVEDNPGDVRLVREALAVSASDVELFVAGDGILALEYLRKQGRFEESPSPDLVLLDLNLPRMSGEEVLTVMKTDPALKMLPIVVFSSAASDVICEPIYREYANSCIRKPDEFEAFFAVIEQICSYWFSLACLPD